MAAWACRVRVRVWKMCGTQAAVDRSSTTLCCPAQLARYIVVLLVLHRIGGKDSEGMCRRSGCVREGRRPACGAPQRAPGPRLRFVEMGGPASWEQAEPGQRWKWGRRTGRFRRPHAGGGDSSNGRQPLRPTRNHRRAPAPRLQRASGCGWVGCRRGDG